MTYAYDKHYLDDSMRTLGEAFDYAANDCGVSLDELYGMFVSSGIARQFEVGVPKYISGMSGTELAMEIFSRAGVKKSCGELRVAYDASPEYWCGWILAYYQWFTSKSFKDIRKSVSMEEVLKMYPTLHEAHENKFVEILDKIIARQELPTKLSALRKNVGYSQKELAEKSGVTIRMIQQYEQRAKDINKASVSNLIALSKTLGCRIEDLLE